MSGDRAAGDGSRRLFLIDGMPIVYQSYFVFLSNPRLTSRGVNTSAAFGYTNSLVKIIEEEQPTHMAVVFDAAGRNRRHDEYGEYKAQREKAPEEMLDSLDDVHAITAALRIPEITWSGAEADDVIGTIAAHADAAGFHTWLVTPDKDLAQLVTDRTTLYRVSRTPGSPASIFGPAQVRERWGVADVSQVVDVLALVGDSVDNIPGVPGIGDKTAQKLLAQFGTVEELIGRAGDLKGKQRERIEQFAEQALLSKRLATIDVDLPVEVDLDSFARRDPDPAATIAIFDRLEFRLLKERLFGDAGDDSPAARGMATIEDTEHDYRVAATASERLALAAELLAGEAVAIDLQSTAGDPKRARIAGVAFAAAPHTAAYVPFPADDQAGYRQALDDLRPVFEAEAVTKVGHYLKHAMSVLAWHGVGLAGTVRDTHVTHSLIDQEGRHRLEQLAERYLDYSPIPLSSLLGEDGKDQLPLLEADPQRLADYAAERADVALRLQAALASELADAEYEGVCHDIESPLIGVLVEMEHTGVTVDVDVLHEYADQLGAEIAALEQGIYEAAEGEFNLNSPKQLGEILFDRLQIDPNPKKTRTGQYMTNEQQLSRYADRHPMIPMLLDYRIVQKLKSTYVDTLPAAVFERTGRIHTTFNQLVAATGRLNSEGPNLQNIPIRTEKGREIRRAFVPARPRLPAAVGRLLADRAAHPGLDRGRGVDAGGPEQRRGHPRGHRVARVRGGARRGHPGDAQQVQDGQLRHRLRHVLIRTGAAAAHRAQGSGRDHRALLHPVPEDPRLHGRGDRVRPRRRVRADPEGPAPLPARHQLPQPHRARGRGAHRHQRPDPGHRGRHDQDRHDRHRPRAETAPPAHADDPAGARRAGVRSAPGRARGGRAARARPDARRAPPGRTDRGRDRRRLRLAQRPLSLLSRALSSAQSAH